jgi:hypothetical protein
MYRQLLLTGLDEDSAIPNVRDQVQDAAELVILRRWTRVTTPQRH